MVDKKEADVSVKSSGKEEKESLLIENETSEKKDDYKTLASTCDEIPPKFGFRKSPNLLPKDPSRRNLHLDIKAVNAQSSFRNTLSPITPISRGGTPKPINVAVFLKEGEGRLLLLERGKLTTAGEVKSKMLEVLSLPTEVQNCFAIWFISPHLELQLKDHHIPFLLRRQWCGLLASFSDCQDIHEATKDEPVLVFQRNSFLSISDEDQVTDEGAIKRLFEEARFNILNAKYPIPVGDAEMLGGMLVCIEEGAFDMNKHRPGYFRKSLSRYLPYYAIGNNVITQYFRSSTLEQRLLQQYQHISSKSNVVLALQRMFLSYCRSLPFYGCAFFKGTSHAERPSWKGLEKSLKVGINRDGVTLFKVSKEELVVHLPYDDFSCELIREEGSVDCLCILCGDESETYIQSRQSCMMDAMINSCVCVMDRLNTPKTPTNTGDIDPSGINSSVTSSGKGHFSLSRPFSLK